MPVTPILSSVLRTIRYHLGTLAKGSFIITLVKIPRLILTYIHSQLKGKVRSGRRRNLKVTRSGANSNRLQSTFPNIFPVVGERLRPLHAQGVRLLPVVPGEVSGLLKSSECLSDRSSAGAQESDRGKALTGFRRFLFRTPTPPPPSTAPASARRPATPSSSWWRTPCE